MTVKMSKQLPPLPTASAVGPCTTVIQSHFDVMCLLRVTKTVMLKVVRP